MFAFSPKHYIALILTSYLMGEAYALTAIDKPKCKTIFSGEQCRHTNEFIRIQPDGKVVRVFKNGSLWNLNPKKTSLNKTNKLTSKVTQKKIVHLTRFSVIPSLSYMRIDGRDSDNAKGFIASGTSPSLKFVWRPRYIGRYGMDFGGMFQKVEFVKSKEKDLVGSSQSLIRLFTGVNYQVYPTLIANAQFGLNDQVFYRSLNTNTIKIEKVQVYYTQAGLQYHIGKLYHINYGLSGAYRLHFPYAKGPYKGKMGHGYLGSFLMSKRFRLCDIQFSVFYSKDTFPQNGVDFLRTELGYSLGFSKSF